MKKYLPMLLFFLSFLIPGCYTYYPVNVNPDSIKEEPYFYMIIQEFILKDSSHIDVSNYEVQYYKKYKNFENVFVCIPIDFTKNQIFSSSSKTKEEKIISAGQVKTVIIEKRKTNVGRTVLGVISITALSIAALFLIIILWTKYGGGFGKVG
jgi:hypothetical protein